MHFLIYIAHPAQYHFCKFIVRDLQKRGHIIKLVIKSKDILENLLQEDGVPYENILPEVRKYKTLGLFLSMLKRDYRLYKIARKIKPDILLGSDTCVTHVGWIIRKPCFGIGEDDFKIVKKLDWLMMPFATGVMAPEVCNLGPFEKKKIAYNGYMKLAYLHPVVFKPDEEFIRKAKLKTPYCLIRMVKLSAHHDNKMKGLNRFIVKEIIQKLESKGYQVYIDSEEMLPADLSNYKLHIKKSWMHQMLTFSTIVISDSQSFSVEAAMLGVPSIRYNDFAGKISVLEELEHKYQLTFGIHTSHKERLFEKIDELLSDKELLQTFRKRKDLMLEEKINVCEFFVWFIDSFPESLKKVKSHVVNNQFMTDVVSL